MVSARRATQIVAESGEKEACDKSARRRNGVASCRMRRAIEGLDVVEGHQKAGLKSRSGK